MTAPRYTRPEPGLYREAADIIRRGGLCKGAFTSDGAHCTLGALRAAQYGVNYEFGVFPTVEVVEPITQLLGLGDPKCSCGCDGLQLSDDGLPGWNDAPERTADEVVGVLEQVAEKLEADR